jgi:uncharacterized repeat protein (TIGR01451 family)
MSVRAGKETTQMWGNRGRIAVACAVAAGIVGLLPATAFAQADLSVAKTDSADPVTTGAQFSYTVAVSNAGPEPATSVSIEDTLPNEVDFVSGIVSSYSEGSCNVQGSRRVTCSLGTIPSGGTAFATITVRARRAGTAVNTATVTAANPNDPTPGNNQDSEETVIQEGPAGPSCAGKTATRVGTDGPDTITGTTKRDVIVGLGGDDLIRGLEGRDVICGGQGNDRLKGQVDGDLVKGGRGDDRVRGAGGADTLAGNAGNDSLGGGPGDDALRGGKGTDQCRGGSGRDTRTGCE